MFRTLLQDRQAIENKFHDANAPYNSLQRFDYVGWEGYEGTGLTDEAMQEGLRSLYARQEGLSHPVAKAQAVCFVLENSKIDIREQDYFVYFHSWRRPLRWEYMYKWHDESFDRRPHCRDTMDDLNRSGAVDIWADYDHVIPVWDDLLSLGLQGIVDRVERYRAYHKEQGTLTEEVTALFDSIVMEYKAVMDLIGRYIAFAEAHPNAKTPVVLPCLKHIQKEAPANTFEALQLMYIFFLLCEGVDNYQTRSLGNGLDQTLLPFYRRDLAQGTFTKEEIGEFLGYFFMQFSAIDNYWGHPFYLGGTDLQGDTIYNELSLLCLEVHDALQLHTPKIQLKINRNTPDAVWNKGLDMARRGAPVVFVCEPGMWQAMSLYGATREEQITCEVSGCYETRVRKNESSATSGYVNTLKAVRYVFTRGMDEKRHKPIGVDTGDIASLQTFEQFYEAFLTQWKHLIDVSVEVTNDYEQDLAWVNPCGLHAGTVESALKAGKDAYSFGVKYNNSNMLCCGFASAVDALMAVKEFVFEKKCLSLAQLGEVLEHNWEGHEELRQAIRRSPHKYGNGDDKTDALAKKMSCFFTDNTNNRPNSRGGVYKAILHSAMMFVWQGEKTGATPDGRKDGEEESKNASPSVGMDKEGAAALIRSAMALKPDTYPESFCLDMMMHPNAVKGEQGLAVMKALVLTYLDGGGQSIQFNIMDAEVLRDAQRHPEKYPNLKVRVAGWSVLWNTVPTVQQDAYIQRAESIR